MIAVAFYNLKGGVGKTTAAVNVAYLAAASGLRVLLWDLDPQGASSFILRVRAHVGDIRRNTFRGDTLVDAIKETDYRNLDLLPADFSYRKFDRILDHLGKPARVMRTLLDTLGAEYDVVFLDCPAGFSLLTEAVLETADLSVVPTIPTPLSVQTLARILKWADRGGSASSVAAFFSMVDRRKALHRRACEWSAEHPGHFLVSHIPYASLVEQISVRRMPLPNFAERDLAATAFADLWSELRTRLEQPPRRPALAGVQSLSMELEYALARELDAATTSETRESARTRSQMPSELATETVIHSFDTENRALTEAGLVLELHESPTGMAVVAGRADGRRTDDNRRAEVHIDRSWGLQILSGEMSPFVVLERRLGRPGPPLAQEIRAATGKRRLSRIDSRVAPLEFPAAATCA